MSHPIAWVADAMQLRMQSIMPAEKEVEESVVDSVEVWART